MDRSPYHSSSRSPRAAPSSMGAGVYEAQEFVDDALYHNAEHVLEQLVESASVHPEITDEEFDQLAEHYSQFCDEVNSRYTDQDSLQTALANIEQLLA